MYKARDALASLDQRRQVTVLLFRSGLINRSTAGVITEIFFFFEGILLLLNSHSSLILQIADDWTLVGWFCLAGAL